MLNDIARQLTDFQPAFARRALDKLPHQVNPSGEGPQLEDVLGLLLGAALDAGHLLDLRLVEELENALLVVRQVDL